MTTATEPCIVCGHPVVLENTQVETYVSYDMIAEGIMDKGTLTVCADPNCKRLVMETIAEHGSHQKVELG